MASGSRAAAAREAEPPSRAPGRSPGTGRARLPRFGPRLQENGDLGALWLPGEAMARCDGTRVTRGAGLFWGMRYLDFDRRHHPTKPLPRGPCRVRTRTPRTCPFFAGRPAPSFPKVTSRLFREEVVGTKSILCAKATEGWKERSGQGVAASALPWPEVDVGFAFITSSSVFPKSWFFPG